MFFFFFNSDISLKTVTVFKLLSIFMSCRHLYSNAKARTDHWMQIWMTAVLDSSKRDLKMHLSWGLKFSTDFIYWEMWEFGLQSMHQFAFDHFYSSWPLLCAILKTKYVFLNVYSCFLPFCFSETYEHIYSPIVIGYCAGIAHLDKLT